MRAGCSTRQQPQAGRQAALAARRPLTITITATITASPQLSKRGTRVGGDSRWCRARRCCRTPSAAGWSAAACRPPACPPRLGPSLQMGAIEMWQNVTGVQGRSTRRCQSSLDAPLAHLAQLRTGDVVGWCPLGLIPRLPPPLSPFFLSFFLPFFLPSFLPFCILTLDDLSHAQAEGKGGVALGLVKHLAAVLQLANVPGGRSAKKVVKACQQMPLVWPNTLPSFLSLPVYLNKRRTQSSTAGASTTPNRAPPVNMQAHVNHRCDRLQQPRGLTACPGPCRQLSSASEASTRSAPATNTFST